MAINKLKPVKLNKEADARTLSASEATDLLNVRFSGNNGGNEGVLKGAFGNAAVTQVLPSGNTVCIGSIVVEATNDIYFFAYNDLNNHSIFKYNFKTNTAVNILTDSVFDFRKYDFVQADAIIDGNADTLLVFTTGRGEPFLINASKAERGGYNVITNVTDETVRLSYYTLAKQPPLYPPTFEFQTETSTNKNYLVDKMFQFAAQYVYTDGHVSAISPYSKIAYSPNTIIFDSLSDPYNSSFNKCVVSIEASKADVDKVKFLAREGNIGTWYEIGEVKNTKKFISNAFQNRTVSIDFFNDKLYKAVSANEENKLFDAVPVDVKALRFSNNRLFCGDYKEDFNNLDLDVQSFVELKDSTAVYNITARNLRTTAAAAISNNAAGDAYYQLDDVNTLYRYGVQLDLSEIPDEIKGGSVISIDFTINQDLLKFYSSTTLKMYVQAVTANYTFEAKGDSFIRTPRLYPEPFAIKKTISVDSDSTKSDVVNLIKNALIGSDFTTKISPDLSNSNFAVEMEDVDQASRDWKFWFGGTIVGTFSEAFDSLADVGSNYLSMNFYFTKVNAKAIKALDDSDKNATIKSGGTTQSSWWTGIWYPPTSSFSFPTTISGLVGKFVAVNNVVSYTSNSILYSKNVQTFKSNAEHNFGIVYEDDRLRRSAVMPINSVAISPVTANKASNIIFKINHTPPDWASKYHIVYGGNDKYDYYEQYSVAEAFVGNSDGFDFDAIYVSMRHLEGKPNSFKDSKFPRIDYEFTVGDRLRILRYEQDNGDGTSGYVQTVGYEFEIADYKFFDANDTPISVSDNSNTNEYRATGWFLVLRDKQYSGFSANDIAADITPVEPTSDWNKNVVVEIYRPKKKETDLVYYGTAVDLPISTYNGTRYHAGTHRDISNSGSVSVSLIITSDADGVTFVTDGEVFVGEVLTFTYNTVVYSLTVSEVTLLSEFGSYQVNFIDEPTQETFTTSQSILSVPVTNLSTIVKITDGDCYLRPRLIKTNSTFNKTTDIYVKTTEYQSQIVEAASLNDFLDSSWYTKGKPNTVRIEAKRTHRNSSVTYSDAYLIDSQRQTISSFNNSLANWVDYPVNYGGIRYMFDDGEALTVLQERRAFVVTVGRNLIEYTDGNANATISSNVISDKPAYLNGDFGVNNNPESAAKDIYGRKFFVDGKQRKVLMINGGTIQAISDIDMDGYFSTLFENFSSKDNRYKIFGCTNGENDEYIVSLQDKYNGYLKVYTESSPPTADYTYTVPLEENDLMVFDYVENDDAIPNWEDELRNWGNLCENWEDWWTGILVVDLIDSQPYVYFPLGATANQSTLPVIITNTTRDFYVNATYAFASNTLVPESVVTCDYNFAEIDATILTSVGDTISFDYKATHWTTRYSFKPENMVFSNDTFFTFKNGVMYKHSNNATPAYYYGTQYNMIIDVISNYDPSKSKIYKSLSIEGNSTGGVVVTTEDQSTTIYNNMWGKQENEWFTFIPRDESSDSWSNYLFIGTLNAVENLWILEFGKWNDNGVWIDTKYWNDTPVAGSNGSTSLKFNNQINMIPIPKGSTLYFVPSATFDSAQATPNTNVNFTPTTTNMTSGIVIGKRNMLFNGTNVLSAGDMVYVKKPSGVDGDYIRGFWVKFAFTITPTSNTEIYAINAIYNTSRLHNELGETDRKEF